MTSDYLKRYFLNGAFVTSTFLIWAAWLWAWQALRQTSGLLILHFSDYTGINQIGTITQVHQIGLTATIIVFINFILARAVRLDSPRLAGVLAASTLFLAILLFMALAAIISVNQ